MLEVQGAALNITLKSLLLWASRESSVREWGEMKLAQKVLGQERNHR